MVRYPYPPERKQIYVFNVRALLAYDEYISFSDIAVVHPAMPVLYYGCGVSILVLHRERGDCRPSVAGMWKSEEKGYDRRKSGWIPISYGNGHIWPHVSALRYGSLGGGKWRSARLRRRYFRVCHASDSHALVRSTQWQSVT